MLLALLLFHFIAHVPRKVNSPRERNNDDEIRRLGIREKHRLDQVFERASTESHSIRHACSLEEVNGLGPSWLALNGS